MQYNGGKEYMVKRHGFGAALIPWLQQKPARIFDLGHGSGAVLKVMRQACPAAYIVANDLHPAIATLLRSVAQGWQPPGVLSEEEFLRLKREAAASAADCPRCQGLSGVHKCVAAVDPLVGFAGFACSYGGMYFSGYARPRPATPNPVAGQRKVLLRDAPLLASVNKWLCMDYRQVLALYQPKPGDLVYFDKPYEGTTGYPGIPPFDHKACWKALEAVAEAGVRVLVSEFQAPDPWQRVWSKVRAQESKYTKPGAHKKVVDSLWTIG